MPRFTHSMGDVAALLDQKIAALRGLKSEVEGKIRGNVKPIENAEALRQISSSLAHALTARRALDDSCCGQICPIDYHV